MKHFGTQQLESKRLILRRYKNEDYMAMYRNWANDAEVTKYLTWPPHEDPEVSRKIMEEWVRSYADEKYYHWAIVLKENGDEPIGDIAAVDMNEAIHMVHIGYCMGRKWWHKGIMSEALETVMRFFFERVEVKRIESRHDPRNPHSGGVMKKCGMKYEGTLRSADWNNQGICDACYYAILRDEAEIRIVL